MDQARLREYEHRCIQEEPPFCQAACPLNVDARAVCRELRGGREDEALKILLRTLPLPRILTSVCEEPCKRACKRQDLGGSVEMRLLERHCLEHGVPPKSPFLPPGGKKIAVVGSGISSLVATFDLSRKGHSVSVFYGGTLGAELSLLVASEDLEDEIDALKKTKVSFASMSSSSAYTLASLAEAFDGIYLGMDDEKFFPDSPAAFEPVSFATPLPRVFSGGIADTFVERASQGRRAAISIVRNLQGASLTANREREGSHETRLYARIQDIPPHPPVLDDARQEACRCLDCQCLECVKVCRYLQVYGGYPKRYAREIYNNLSVVQGTRAANKMINSCTECGLCAAVCPNGFDMGRLCSEARLEMVRQGKMPPSAHEFALQDMEHASGAAALRPLRPARDTQKDRAEGSTLCFFPGCQLTASDPELVKRVYAFLRNELGNIGIWLDCCGAPARWAGREDLFADKAEILSNRWKNDGEPELILACSACLQVFRRELSGIKVSSIWEILERSNLPTNEHPQQFTLYEPCTLRGEPRLSQSLRQLALKSGIKLQNADSPVEIAECCGYGGLQYCANPGLSDETTSRIASKADSDLLVACAMCRDRFASVGKRATHLLDLLFPDGTDAAGRLAPRFSDRRENRERLREALLSELQGIPIPPKEAVSMKLSFTPGMKEKLDKRRILDEDLLRVIRHAESTGRKMHSPEGHSLAYLKPRNVTTWVEYTLDGDFCAIHNAWTHRMMIPGSEAQP